MKEDMWDLAYEPDNYLDSEAFKAYLDNINQVIRDADEPVTIRRIHQLLGDAAKPDWTMDALEMSRAIVSIGVLRTRYQAKPAARR